MHLWRFLNKQLGKASSGARSSNASPCNGSPSNSSPYFEHPSLKTPLVLVPPPPHQFEWCFTLRCAREYTHDTRVLALTLTSLDIINVCPLAPTLTSLDTINVFQALNSFPSLLSFWLWQNFPKAFNQLLWARFYIDWRIELYVCNFVMFSLFTCHFLSSVWHSGLGVGNGSWCSNYFKCPS